MKRYMFTDCITPPQGSNLVSDSVSGSISCDICGKQYEDLIRLCCKYSGVFSFIVQVPAMEVAEQLEKFRIERPENIEFSHNHYITNENTEPGGRFYRVCPELCEFLLDKADSIYEWINGWDFENPEDPTFYRKDGSVFFTSVIHEGEVFLLPRDDEDVSIVINNDYWREVEPDSIIASRLEHMLHPRKD